MHAHRQGKQIHEWGLVSVLKQIHDALNAERAAEEKRGLICWLRPEFQNPDGDKGLGFEDSGEATSTKKTATKSKQKQKPTPWPKGRAPLTVLRQVLATASLPLSPDEMDKRLRGGRNRKAAAEDLLQILVDVGQIRQTDEGRFVIAG